MLPKGSLDALGRRHGVKRLGSAHTAGSDALLTLELFMLLGGSKLLPDALGVFDKLDEAQQQDQWAEVASEVSWPSADDWYPSDSDQWYAGNGRTAAYSDSSTDASEVWGAPDSSWASQSQTNNHWFSTSSATSEYSSGYSGYSPTYGSVYSSGGNGFFASL
jgi:hypothetical protein